MTDELSGDPEEIAKRDIVKRGGRIGEEGKAGLHLQCKVE